MAYITPYKTWSTGETLDAENANGNLQNIITGLDSGTKDINVSSIEIDSTTKIDSSGVFTGDITGDVTGTVSDISNHEPKDLSDISSVGSGEIITGTERTNFTSAYTDTQAATDSPSPSTIVKRDANGDFSTLYFSSHNSRLAWGTFELDPASPTMSNSYYMTSITYDGTGKFFAIKPSAWMDFSVDGTLITDWLKEAGQITITEIWDGTIREIIAYDLDVFDSLHATYPSSIIVTPISETYGGGVFSTATGVTQSHYGTIHLNVFRSKFP